MSYEEFLAQVVERGLAGARKSYADDPDRLRGASDGLEACRGKDPAALAALLRLAGSYARTARLSVEAGRISSNEYWKVRCFEAEVEWVCNAVSAVLLNEGREVVVTPTARAFLLAADIVGVRPAGGRPS